MTIRKKKAFFITTLTIITLAWILLIISRSTFNGTFNINQDNIIYAILYLILLDGLVFYAFLGVIATVLTSIFAPKGQSRKQFAMYNDFDSIVEKLPWIAFPINILFALIQILGIANIASPFIPS